MQTKIDKNSIEAIMERVLRTVPVFCSDADFTHHFMRAVEDTYKDERVGVYTKYRMGDMYVEPGRLEDRIGEGIQSSEKKQIKKSGEIDVVIYMDKKKIPVELTYNAIRYGAYGPGYNFCRDGYANFQLGNSSAKDLEKYNFYRDILNFEKLVDSCPWTDAGYAIFLTNDQTYWTKSRTDTADADFHLYDGCTIRRGAHIWRGDKLKKPQVELSGEYAVKWNFYDADFECDCPKTFGYTVVEVKKPV